MILLGFSKGDFAGLGLVATSLLALAMSPIRAAGIISSTLLPVALASAWAGVLLVRRLPAERFCPVIHGLLVRVGLELLWDGIRPFGSRSG